MFHVPLRVQENNEKPVAITLAQYNSVMEKYQAAENAEAAENANVVNATAVDAADPSSVLNTADIHITGTNQANATSTTATASSTSSTSSNQISEQEREQFHFHQVQPEDTLIRLAVYYGTTENAITRANQFKIGKQLTHLIGNTIRIPKIPNFNPTTSLPIMDPEIQRQNQAMKAFMAAADQDCTEQLAKYYLSEHEYNHQLALQAYHEDRSWEKTQGQHQKYMSATIDTSLPATNDETKSICNSFC